jgi:hypothetical protein
MTHPPNVCAHCEDGRDPVTMRNGYRFEFQVADGVSVEFCLHAGCVDYWCGDFNFFPYFKDNASAQRGACAGY